MQFVIHRMDIDGSHSALKLIQGNSKKVKAAIKRHIAGKYKIEFGPLEIQEENDIWEMCKEAYSKQYSKVKFWHYRTVFWIKNDSISFKEVIELVKEKYYESY